MLTAFNYYDPEEENRIRRGFKESSFFQRERDIAEKFSVAHPRRGEAMEHCPICDSKDISLLFEKWGIRYLRCGKCYSILADVDPEAVKEYTELDELRKLRLFPEFQKEGAAVRRRRWEEIIDWLRFRVYRYCGKKEGLSVIHYGNRWKAFREMLESSGLCGSYRLKNSILSTEDEEEPGRADLLLSLDDIQQRTNPREIFRGIRDILRPNGLFILSTKMGSGLDVLVLRGKNGNVFPYEHVLMPSKEGLQILLEDAGMELLEFTTPGTFDINYVRENREQIPKEEYFIRYFLDTASPNAEAEFQRFIQRAGLSSYGQIVARKKDV